ncbi:MAG: polysaccharide biosynthesis tyrosine autokinase [Elusimicrobiota bacterium]|jgi:capsular exopolysaccharide synthesis family protein
MDEQPAENAPDIDLASYLQVLVRRRWVVLSAFLVSTLGALLYVFTARPVYSASALLLIEKERRAPVYSEGAMVEASDDDYYQTQYRLLKSRSLLRKVHQNLALSKAEDFSSGVEALERAVAISPVRRSRLVNVTVESHDPALAAGVANAVAASFVAENVENKLFISKEILAALYPGGAAKDPRDVSPDSLPAVVNSQLIQTLKASYAGLEARWGDLSRRYTPEHPEVIRLKSQMEALRSRIQDETGKIVQSMKAELSGQLLGNNVRIVDPAEVPRTPSKPRKARSLALAALLGLLAGFFLALGADALDQTVRSQEDVERKLGLPFLGAVPRATFAGDSLKSYVDVLAGPDSFTGESLRNIRTMLGFAGAGRDLKTLLITSTTQGEGKTFLAMSLAIVFAQLGEKVLLLEGDLRRPNVHKRFAVNNESGVSWFLAHGKDVSELEGLVRPSGVANLDVLPCGRIPPNPSELLSTPRVNALIGWARGRYDRVIVDGTPVLPISDALLWGRHADAAVFVAKFGGAHALLARRARQKIEEGGLRISGAVLNQVTGRGGRYYGDYHYYYRYSNSDKKPSA